MPTPLNANENIYVDHKIKPSNYAMPTMEAAFDHYSIGYLITGDRKWFSYSKVGVSHPGDVGFQKPGIFHQNLPLSDEPYERFLIKYRRETIAPVIELIGEDKFEKLHNGYLHFPKESQKRIRPLFDDMLMEYERHAPFSQLMLQGMLQRLILTIYEEKLPYEESSLELHAYDERIHSAFVYVENHLSESPTLTEAAAFVGLSTTYFSKRFHMVTGKSYSEYLTSTKLQHAQILLATTCLSISEVAIRTGFSNGNYMCNVFQQNFHTSPSDFRKSSR